MDEIIIEHREEPRFRIMYPVEFKGKEYLVIQKRKIWQDEFSEKGGVYIAIDDTDDAQTILDLAEGLMQMLEGSGFLEIMDEEIRK